MLQNHQVTRLRQGINKKYGLSLGDYHEVTKDILKGEYNLWREAFGAVGPRGPNTHLGGVSLCSII